MSALEITIIPCLKDNYAYLVTCRETRAAAVVDPSESLPVLAAVEAEEADLVAIWNTHHHWDHTGGNEGLLAVYPQLAVYGHVSDEGRIPGQTVFLTEGDAVSLGRSFGDVMHIPGHTAGAVAYVIDGKVFTGDTLFYGGCGRLFEGTPAMMFESLVVKLKGRLAPETLVYPGHEYTVNNLQFAQTIEPNNASIAECLSWAKEQRSHGLPTVPSTLAIETEVNPFMRATTVEELAERRTQKDSF
jgi:hydroxyacylglutathione hydrolase